MIKSNENIIYLAQKFRKQVGEDENSPIDIFSVIYQIPNYEITLVSYPFSNNISGMCIKKDNSAIICINSNSSYGRQRFTLAHEIYHVCFENEISSVVCSNAIGVGKIDSEINADNFAGYLLMPYGALYERAATIQEWSLENIIEFEQYFQVSHQAILYRLKQEGYISNEQHSKFSNVSITSEAIRLGYNKELYEPTKEEFKYFTRGAYIKGVEKLYTLGKISSGKREELLLDAYRPDIVYNLYEGGIND